MTTHTPVPADIDPASLADLVEDCREVSGVLAPLVTSGWFAGAVRVPAPTTPAEGPLPVHVPTAAGIDLDGYGYYGS